MREPATLLQDIMVGLVAGLIAAICGLLMLSLVSELAFSGAMVLEVVATAEVYVASLFGALVGHLRLAFCSRHAGSAPAASWCVVFSRMGLALAGWIVLFGAYNIVILFSRGMIGGISDALAVVAFAGPIWWLPLAGVAAASAAMVVLVRWQLGGSISNQEGD